MLRFATLDDLDRLLELSLKLHEASPYSHWEFNRQKTAEYYATVIEADNNVQICLVSCDKDKIYGMIVGHVISPVFSDVRLAVESANWVEPEYRKSKGWFELLKAYVYWADKVGCSSVQHNSLTERYGKFLEKRGFNQQEQVYQKELN